MLEGFCFVFSNSLINGNAFLRDVEICLVSDAHKKVRTSAKYWCLYNDNNIRVVNYANFWA